VLGLAGGAVYAYSYSTPKAEVKVIIESQPLTRSLSIRVEKDSETSAEGKVLRGFGAEASTTETGSLQTTGEKLVGTKATGKVRIFNKTDADKTFEAGTKFYYGNLVFVLDQQVIVPAREDSMEIPPVITIGEATADVTAEDIGDEYNIDEGRALEIEGYRTTEFVASSENRFSGGESKTVRVVAEADRTNLSAKTLEANIAKGRTALGGQLAQSQKLINGSTKSLLVTEEFNAAVEDETDTLEITQSITTTGLVYDQRELEEVIDELIKEFIPDGFVASAHDKEINVEVLGNSDSSVLSSEEADIQVTIRTFVAPEVDEEKIINDLVGKNITEAQRIISGIRNLEGYELNVTPKLLSFNRMPKKVENINLEVIFSD
jgi:hypothetical protein